MHNKSMIAGPGFPLGARQCVLLFGIRVQENGEISADLRVSRRDHLFGRTADHHPVIFMVRVAQKGVADGAAYAEDFHGLTLLLSFGGAPAGAINKVL